MRKVISIILTICMLTILSLTPVHVNAGTPAEQPTVTENTESKELVNETTAEPKVWQNPLEENIYTKIVDNGDGTQTATLYDHPVRFVNEEGRLQDISLEIAAASDGAYRTLAAESQTVFPKTVSDGITLSGNGVSLKMTPAKPVSSGKLTASTEKFSSLSSAVTKVDNQKVAYEYDSKTRLEYQLTYTGFKEDIVVLEYTGQTEYHFLLETNGLALTKIDESYYLTDENGEIKATIGDIIIFTADERNNALGSMTHTAIRENEQYIMTIHVDADYLKDEKTKYPIRIDPTMEITYDNYGAGAIEDVTICSGGSYSGTSGSLYIGNRSDKGRSRALIKFPGVNFSSLTNVDVQSAYVQIRDILCESSELTLEARTFMGNTWSESSSTTWANVDPDSYAVLYSYATVSYAIGNSLSPKHRYSFDITSPVQSWISGTFYSPDKGIMIMALEEDNLYYGETYIHKTFASYNRASNKPSLVITYSIDHQVYRDPNDQDYMMVGTTQQLCATFPMSSSTVSFSVPLGDNNIVTVTNEGLIRARNIGDTVITASIKDPITQEVVATSTIPISVRDYVGLSDGTSYYIMNKSSGRFLSAENKNDATGTNVVTKHKSELIPEDSDNAQFPFSNPITLAQWTYDNDSDYLRDEKKATLTNVFSPTGKMLDVEGVNVDIWNHTGSGCQHFTIFRSNNPDYSGLYCIRYGPYFVTEYTDHNVYLTTTATAASFWSFMKVDKGTAEMVAFSYEHSDGSGSYNSATNFNTFYYCFNSMGYSTFTTINPTVDSTFAKLQNSDIFLYSGHGNNSKLALCNDKNNAYAWILGSAFQLSHSGNLPSNIKDVAALPDNALCDVRCIFYLGCNTGLSDGNVNLVDNTFDKGAHFVFGVCDETYCEVDQWLPSFFDCLMHGESVGDAINSADDCVRNNRYTINTAEQGIITIDGYFNRNAVGDTEQFLYFEEQ